MYKIGTFNKISPVGLNKLTDDYTIIDDHNEAQGIILRSYDMHEMDFSDNLLAIGRAGAGTNNVPVDRCTEMGICVFNAPGANANAVKELVICGMIMAARNVTAGYSWAKTLVGSEGVGKQIEKGKGQFAGVEIMGKTLGVIGLGAIGVLVANAAVALGMKVVGYDAFLRDKAKANLDSAVEIVSDLPDLYPVCDFISIHVPANDSTKGMMNKEAFDQMKDGVFFLNFARDKLINDKDLLDALASGKVETYVTDFADDTVLNANQDDIIVLPHLGASSAEAEENCASMAVTQVMDYLENGNITNSVNMPNVSLGKRKGARVAVFCKENAASDVLGKLVEYGATEMESASKKGYSYILANVSVPEFKLDLAGVIKTRYMK